MPKLHALGSPLNLKPQTLKNPNNRETSTPKAVRGGGQTLGLWPLQAGAGRRPKLSFVF